MTRLKTNLQYTTRFDHEIKYLRHYYHGEISSIGKKSLKILSILLGGTYHIPSSQLNKIKWDDPYCISFTTIQSFATFDNSLLTTLVLLAHDFAVRVEIKSCNCQYLKVLFHERQREGNLYERHPTMEHVLEKWREKE